MSKPHDSTLHCNHSSSYTNYKSCKYPTSKSRKSIDPNYPELPCLKVESQSSEPKAETNLNYSGCKSPDIVPVSNMDRKEGGEDGEGGKEEEGVTYLGDVNIFTRENGKETK